MLAGQQRAPDLITDGCELSRLNECRQIVKNIYSFNGEIDLQYHGSFGEQEAEGAVGCMPGRFIGKH